MKVLDRLPIPENRSSLRFGDRYTTLHRDQVLVWLSISLAGDHEPDEKTARFPALLRHREQLRLLSLRDQQLRNWAGIDPGHLMVLGEIKINGQPVTRRRATVWLYPNVPCSRKMASNRRPFRLGMGKGIAVYSQDASPSGPRLPLLGLPAFLDNDLDLWLDPERRQITAQVRAPGECPCSASSADCDTFERHGPENRKRACKLSSPDA